MPIEVSCLNKPIVVDHDYRFVTYATLLDIKGPPLPNLVSVIKIEIEDHLKTFTPIMNIAHYCLLSERIKVAPIIKKLLKEQRRKCPNLDILKIRSDEAIAKLLVLGGKTSYHHITHVVTYGCDALIEAMDRGRLSVYLSAMIAKFSHDKQLALLQKDKNLIVKQLRSLQH